MKLRVAWTEKHKNKIWKVPGKPAHWFLGWATYTLLALGWMGYKNAILGYLCLVPI